MDLKTILTDKTIEMGDLLTDRFGARKQMLSDKFDEVSHKLVDFGFDKRKFDEVKGIRNKYQHVRNYEYNGNKEMVVADCDELIEQLKSIDPHAHLRKKAAAGLDKAVKIAPPSGRQSSYEKWASQKELNPAGDLYRLPETPSIEERKLLLSNQKALAVDIYEPDPKAGLIRNFKIVAIAAGAILTILFIYYAAGWVRASMPRDIFAKSDIDTSIPPTDEADKKGEVKQTFLGQYEGDYQYKKHKFTVAERKGKFVIESADSTCEMETTEIDNEFQCVKSTTGFKGKILFVKNVEGKTTALKIIADKTKAADSPEAAKIR